MLVKKALALFAVMLVASVFCLSMAVADDSCSTCPNNTCAITQNQAPTGAGPAEIAQQMSVAPVGVIMERGHVNNVCEAQLMTLDNINQHGGMLTNGDYKVAYFLGAPEGSYKMKNGKLAWQMPSAKQNQHIDVVVMDSLTSMPIPMSTKIEVLDQNGKVVDSRNLDYVWSPMGEHYGSNFAIPCAGSYTLRITAPAPTFLRHNCQLGNRFTCPLDARFTCVQLKPMTCVQPAPAEAGPCNTCPSTAPCPPNGL